MQRSIGRKRAWIRDNGGGRGVKKIVFFDVDGTLLPEGTPNVPESTVRAMKKLKENDIGICLCTGRHPIELRQLNLLMHPFNGFALLNGQLVMDRIMKVIGARTIEELDKEELLSLFNRHAASMILVEKYPENPQSRY